MCDMRTKMTSKSILKYSANITLSISSLFRKVLFSRRIKSDVDNIRKKINKICHGDCRDEWQKSAISLKVRKHPVYTVSWWRSKKQLGMKYIYLRKVLMFWASKLFPKIVFAPKCNFEMTYILSARTKAISTIFSL